MHDFFQQLGQLRHVGQRVSLATLVNTLGTSPRKEGAKMWVEEGGDILGSVTIGGCVDSRPRFATPERFLDTDKLIVGIPSEIVETLPMSSVTAVILVAHDYKYDLPILRHVLSSPAGYIGVLGSRRRGEGLLKFLQEEGMAEEELQRIRVPIGLDLGGQTAPEIALAILAEVL
jgi:xanthine/CO dehydrogenase XdhC/CoxF family maturation factor